jgi:hypothetical protein
MKRALAKAKQNDASIRHTNLTHKSSSPATGKPHHTVSQQRTSSRTKSPRESNLLLGLSSSTSSSSRDVKRQRLDSKSNGSKLENSQSEAMGMRAAAGDQFINVVAMSQLKEQVLGLQKQIQKNNQELLDKDKKVSVRANAQSPVSLHLHVFTGHRSLN